ncbi:MAG TPA: T9SS type A sorting domain-containing protein [archaeon]|nr:T9SS type A sorting domain-containing protein [archaeon]
MKSRLFSSTTVIFFLLLGLVSTNLFAQITDASSVDFTIRAYGVGGSNVLGGGYRTVSDAISADTVGHKFDLMVKWEAPRQELSGGVYYTVTFPAGTALYSTALKDNGIKITYRYWDSGTSQTVESQFYVQSADIEVLESNDTTTASYESDVAPRVKIKDVNTFSDKRVVEMEFLKGIWYGKSVTDVNEYFDEDYDTDQGYMKIRLSHSSTTLQEGNFVDSTSFYVENDLADHVTLNENITAIATTSFWPDVDSVIVVDRFGNYVPDYFEGPKDELWIYAATDQGDFTSTPTKATGAGAAWDGAFDPTPGTTSYRGDTYITLRQSLTTADAYRDTLYFYGANGTHLGTISEDEDGVWDITNDEPVTAQNLIHQIVPDLNAGDGSRVILYLGQYGADSKLGTYGIKFTAEDDVDSVEFTFKLVSADPTASLEYLYSMAQGRLLNVPATNKTVVKLGILSTDVAYQVGSITFDASGPKWTKSTNTNFMYNGRSSTDAGLGTFKISLLDKFGDKFDDLTMSGSSESKSGIEKVVLDFRAVDLTYYAKGEKVGSTLKEYQVKSYTWNNTRTGILKSGTTVGGYSRPATHFKYSSGTTKIGGDTLKEFSVASSVVDLSTLVYLGTTSHPDAEAIQLIAYAIGDRTVADSILIKVQPGPPIAWDVSVFADSLNYANANKQVVQNATIPHMLPIFALDTAYNYVTNMDLKADKYFIDGVAHPTYDINGDDTGNDLVKMLNFLINDRDPVSYNLATGANVLDSLTLDNPGATRPWATGLSMARDSSFIYNLTAARKDSSRLNLGGVDGEIQENDDILDPALGLRLNYIGIGNRLSIKWKAGMLGTGTAGKYAAGLLRTQELGIFNLEPAAAIDSVTNLSAAAAAGDTAGATVTKVVQFDIPVGDNTLRPDGADSTIFIVFPDLPSGSGIPSGITKAKVKVAVGTGTAIEAVAVFQGTDKKDSIAIVTPLVLDASATSPTVKVSISDFVNPTKSDTGYSFRVSTEASPVWAKVTGKSNKGMLVSDGGFRRLHLIPPGGTNPITNKAKYFTDISRSKLDTLKVGVQSLFRALKGDNYGNVISSSTGFGLIVKGPGKTTLGTASYTTTVKHTYAGVTKTSTGTDVYDTVHVSIDIDKNESASVVDSLLITFSKAGSYYLAIMDSARIDVIDSVMIAVKPTIAKAITRVSPDTTIKTTRLFTLADQLKVSLKDTYGNALADSVVHFAVISGSATFKGTTKDTADVQTGSDGVAGVTVKTGAESQNDSIAIEVSMTGRTDVTKAYFSILTKIVSVAGASQITFKNFPNYPKDSTRVASLDSQAVAVDVRDGDKIKAVYLRVLTTALTMSEGKFTLAAVTDTVLADSAKLATTLPDSYRFNAYVPARKLADYVRYQIKVVDNIDSIVYSPFKKYIVGPPRGKRNLSTAPTTVTDLMTCVYLLLGAQTADTLDYLGLDLDGNGIISDIDLSNLLKIWKGDTTVLLAGVAQKESRSAKVELGYQEVDKANANLTINMESKGNLNLGVFKIKYDTEKFVLGEATAAGRLGDLTVVSHNNEAEGVYGVVVINIDGRPIPGGSGVILSIPVSAVGDKFDGTGDISLLSVGFEEDVQAEMNREALSLKAVLPKVFALRQNYPNPFNPSTTISYDIPEGQQVDVSLNIYNMRGQLIQTLVNEVKSEGSYQVQWDGTDNHGRTVSSGVYFYRIKAGDFSKTRKMVILK